MSNRVFAVGVGMTRFEKVEKGSLGIKYTRVPPRGGSDMKLATPRVPPASVAAQW